MKIEDELKSTISWNTSKKVILNLLFTQNLISENFNVIHKTFDISSEQYNVLRILRGQKGKPANMFSIQERMICKTSNTTRLVDKLLLKNLVTRDVCPENRRKIEVSITKNGLNLLLQMDPIVDKLEADFAKNLTKNEQENIIILLEKLRTKIN